MGDLSLFDAARAAVSLKDLAEREVKLKRAGREHRGQCPLCEAGAKKGASGPFAILKDGASFRCYVCGAHGDVTDLERLLRGGTPGEAARRLAGPMPAAAGAPRPSRPRPKEPEGPSAADRIALAMWRTAQPFAGSIAETYLKSRGILPEVVALAADQLRFHPAAEYAWDEDARRWLTCPAMVAPVVVWDAEAGKPVWTGGVHATYLRRDGRGKAALDPAKRMWGPQGRDGKPGGAWLIGPHCRDLEPGSDLAAAEGIETVLSMVSLSVLGGGPMMRAVAALSLDRLQGRELRDEDNCIDVWVVKADPEGAAFTWPVPAADPWPTVVIGVDGDMGTVKVKGRTGRGRVCEFRRDGDARAKVCAKLATLAWFGAGSKARAIRPKGRLDFNDELRRVRALESAA